jgi:hypothetical protein
MLVKIEIKNSNSNIENCDIVEINAEDLMQEVLLKYLDYLNHKGYRNCIRDITNTTYFDEVLWSEFYYDIDLVTKINLK